MDISIIVVVVFGVLFCVGGPILAHYATKVSEKDENQEKN